MKLTPLRLFCISIFLLSFTVLYAHKIPYISPVQAQSEEEIDQKRKEIEDLQNKLNELDSQKVTLSNTIEKISTQIKISESEIAKTQAEINQLEKQIAALTVQIADLETSLTSLSESLITHINQMYRQKQTSPVQVLIDSNGMSDFITRYRYMKIAQAQTRKIMVESESQKVDFDQQKLDKERAQAAVEAKKRELETQKAQLAAQQQQQKTLLAETQNNEVIFQQKLQQARAEYEALQAIIAGKGDESEVGPVNEGDRIASVLTSGPSLFCNSTGHHLHFTITDSSRNSLNPFDFLKPVDYQDFSKQGSCTEPDLFNPHGTWNWPIDPPITFAQGYGNTCASQTGVVSQFYSFHNGIDFVGSNITVKAVQKGVLYRGSYDGEDTSDKNHSSCKLPYVRVQHEDGRNSFYLHVSY